MSCKGTFIMCLLGYVLTLVLVCAAENSASVNLPIKVFIYGLSLLMNITLTQVYGDERARQAEYKQINKIYYNCN